MAVDPNRFFNANFANETNFTNGNKSIRNY